MYATRHPLRASTPRSHLCAHSVLSRGMATTPPPRVRQQLPLRGLPAVRQQALHATSAVIKGHSTVSSDTSPSQRGQWPPLRVATSLFYPQALHQTSAASKRRSTGPASERTRTPCAKIPPQCAASCICFQLLLKAEMLLHLPHFEEADPLQVEPELGWPEGRCGTQKLLREASQAWATGRKSSNIAGEILPCDACNAPRTVGTGE